MLNSQRVSRTWQIRHRSAIIREIPPRFVRPYIVVCRFPPSVTFQAAADLGFHKVSHGRRDLSHGTLHFLRRPLRGNALSWAISRQYAWGATRNENMQRGMRLTCVSCRHPRALTCQAAWVIWRCAQAVSSL
jgi:hypothetical protein